MFRNTLLIAAMATMIAPAFAAEWISDFDAAKAKAAQENKAILADFTGSDWCGWCIRLRQSVLDTPAFEAYAKDKFVLAEIDVPQAPKLSPEQMQKNRLLCEQYNIQGFPTILVMDAEGRVMGGFSGGKTSLQDVQAPLDKGLENIRLAQQAATQQGDEKLQTLVKIYNNIPPSLKENAAYIRDAILALDPANAGGIKTTLLAEQQKEQFKKELATAQSAEQALAMLERMKGEVLPPNRTELLMQLFTLKMECANTVEDLLAAKAILLEAAETMPDRKAAIQAAAEKQFANPAALLEQIKTYRRKTK
ncbi:MAG: thioredoxin family protein [Akkermansia sp.]|nr:thioredoxin family protein [Akkermansia sp.]